MKTHYSIKGIFMVCLFAISAFQVADAQDDRIRKIKVVEEAMELEEMEIRYNPKTGTGSIKGKVCDSCEEQTVKITPQTKAYYKGQEVSMSHAGARGGRNADVFFDVETKHVTRIVW